MVNLVKPTIKRGVPETVCDPTMGTAGFLSMVVKYLGSAVDWKKHQSRIQGCDHDERVSAFARVNMFLETGQVFENLKRTNSLKNDLPREEYDIILGNPPFGIDSVKYSQCHPKIRNLGIPATTCSEAIFLQLIMASLAPNGRAAVVFPVSLLENKTQSHTRRYLLDNFELLRIIRMNTGNKKKDRFFLNTSVRCCIIYFQKTGKPTSSIAYSEIERCDNGLVETFVRDIPVREIDADSTLSVWKPQNGTEGTALEDICLHKNGKPIAKKNLVYTIGALKAR
jgi:type I restriction enzyme M protein